MKHFAAHSSRKLLPPYRQSGVWRSVTKVCTLVCLEIHVRNTVFWSCMQTELPQINTAPLFRELFISSIHKSIDLVVVQNKEVNKNKCNKTWNTDKHCRAKKSSKAAIVNSDPRLWSHFVFGPESCLFSKGFGSIPGSKPAGSLVYGHISAAVGQHTHSSYSVLAII